MKAAPLNLHSPLTRLLKLLLTWYANDPRLLKHVPSEDQQLQVNFDKDEMDSLKTLEMIWLIKTDQFKIKTNVMQSQKITKWIIPSEIVRLFDLLGLKALVVTRAKIILQQLWKLKLDWDAAVPQKIYTEWTSFWNKLDTLDHLETLRHVCLSDYTKIQLCIGKWFWSCSIHLIIRWKSRSHCAERPCAKSRLAPVKKPTTPRLEHQGSESTSKWKIWWLFFGPVRRLFYLGYTPRHLTTTHLSQIGLEQYTKQLLLLNGVTLETAKTQQMSCHVG